MDGSENTRQKGGKAKEKEKRGSTISLISSGGIGNTFSRFEDREKEGNSGEKEESQRSLISE